MPVQNWLELSALPTILSFEPLPLTARGVARGTPRCRASNEKLRSALSMLRLFEIVIEPGLLL